MLRKCSSSWIEATPPIGRGAGDSLAYSSLRPKADQHETEEEQEFSFRIDPVRRRLAYSAISRRLPSAIEGEAVH